MFSCNFTRLSWARYCISVYSTYAYMFSHQLGGTAECVCTLNLGNIGSRWLLDIRVYPYACIFKCLHCNRSRYRSPQDSVTANDVFVHLYTGRLRGCSTNRLYTYSRCSRVTSGPLHVPRRLQFSTYVFWVHMDRSPVNHVYNNVYI